MDQEKPDYLKSVKAIVADQLGMDEKDIQPENDLHRDLGADSLDQVEIVMAFEEEYGLEICDEELEALRTVADLVKCLEGKIPA